MDGSVQFHPFVEPLALFPPAYPPGLGAWRSSAERCPGLERRCRVLDSPSSAARCLLRGWRGQAGKQAGGNNYQGIRGLQKLSSATAKSEVWIAGYVGLNSPLSPPFPPPLPCSGQLSPRKRRRGGERDVHTMGQPPQPVAKDYGNGGKWGTSPETERKQRGKLDPVHRSIHPSLPPSPSIFVSPPSGRRGFQSTGVR